MFQNNVYDLLQKLNESLNNVLEYSNSEKEVKLERFLYNLEKIRAEIYDEVRYINEENLDNYIDFIEDNYKAELKEDILSLYIPEKLPNLKNRSSYAHKQIILNVARITKPYKMLFYDKYVIVIVKIYEKRRIWDADNRTIKPIQDGLIYGGIIKDDNILNSCYMVQGFYSENPHIEVSILEANKIVKFIDNKLPKISK